MRNWSLRVRLTALLGTTLSVFAALSSVAYITHSRAEDSLEAGFSDQLAVLTQLPSLRGGLRRMDSYSDNYLLTRDPVWLGRCAEAAREFRASHARIGPLLRNPQERAEWAQLGDAFERYAADQDALLARARRDGVSRADAVRLALANEPVDSLIERMSGFGRLGFEELDQRRRAARHAALGTFGLVLAFGVLGSIALSAAVARIVLQPVQQLQGQASSWHLGEPWTLAAPEDGSPELRELMGAMRSMADQLNAQYEREREAGRLKSQLVSGVSHEFNNALAVIHTAHALLKERQPDTAETAPWHDMLAANIGALSTMATNLLNLGRLEAGRFALEPRRIDAATLLRASLARLEVLARRKRLAVALEAADGLPACEGDPDALNLVVANLFSNAVKYTPEGGSVTLGARGLPDGRVELFVRDTGIGVAPSEREKILSGYYRTEEGKKAAGGFGVGLALSKMILEAHGSALELESAPGKGSRFSFALSPAKPGPASGTLG